jgi:hypothetical protein
MSAARVVSGERFSHGDTDGPRYRRRAKLEVNYMNTSRAKGPNTEIERLWPARIVSRRDDDQRGLGSNP